MAIKWPARRGETADVTALADLTDVSVAPVTSGFVMVANGSQYVGRLLLEADISDLQAEVNDLSVAVTWANIPIANVPTGSTSSTVALGDHLHDGILDTNLLDKTAFEIVTGRWDFESDGSEPQLCIVDSDSNGVATRAFIEFLGKGDVLTGRMGYLTASSGIFTIDNALPNAGVELTSAGVQKLRVDIDGTIVTGTIFIDNTSGEKVVLRDTNSTGNAVLNFIAFKDMNDLRQGVIGFGSSSNDDLIVQTDSAFGDVILKPQGANVLRASNAAVAISVPLTATSYDGILAANLLDRTATEIISGVYKFTNVLGLEIKCASNAILNFDAPTVRIRRQGTNIISANSGTINLAPAGTTILAVTPTAVNITQPLTATSYDGILAANLLDKAASETISGAYTFSAAMTLASTAPKLTLRETDAAADNKDWDIVVEAELLRFRVVNDAGAAANWLTVSRTGIAVDMVTFGSPVTANAGLVLAGKIIENAVLEDYAIQKHSEASSAGVLTLDMALGNSIVYTFTENVTSVVVENPPVSGKHGEIWLRLVQHASAPKTISWPAKFHFPAGTDHQQTGTNSAVDIVHMVTIDGGTVYDCTFVQDSK